MTATYLAANGTTLLCTGCRQKALSEHDEYHDICAGRVPVKLCGSCGGVPCRFVHPPVIKHKIPWEKPVVTVPPIQGP